MGPLPGPPFPNTHISPIGIIPKASGGWRMITHLSYPSSLSINDFIDPDLCSVKYTSFDQVIEMISLLEAGAELGKVDMKNAFRLIRVYPGDFHLLCYKFKDKYYIDKCLPFGCSISCSIFEKLSTFVHWLTVKQSGLQSMEHYLDDFIFAGKAGTSDCLNLMHCFQDICAELGIPLAHDKTVGPVTKLTFLGIEIDTITRSVKIPEPKIVKLKAALEAMLHVQKPS